MGVHVLGCAGFAEYLGVVDRNVSSGEEGEEFGRSESKALGSEREVEHINAQARVHCRLREISVEGSERGHRRDSCRRLLRSFLGESLRWCVVLCHSWLPERDRANAIVGGSPCEEQHSSCSTSSASNTLVFSLSLSRVTALSLCFIFSPA